MTFSPAQMANCWMENFTNVPKITSNTQRIHILFKTYKIFIYIDHILHHKSIPKILRLGLYGQHSLVLQSN